MIIFICIAILVLAYYKADPAIKIKKIKDGYLVSIVLLTEEDDKNGIN